MVIYKIANIANGKIYIGQTTKTVEERFKQHCYRHKQGVSYIGDAIQKYGKSNFSIEVIDTANSAEELNEKEKFWIRHYNSEHPNGYNLTAGGSGMLASAAVRERMSLKKKGVPSGRKGKPLSAEHKIALKGSHADFSGKNNPNYGKTPSQATRDKISASLKGRYAGERNPFYGKKHTPDEIERWRQSRAWYVPTDETKRKISAGNKGKRNIKVRCIETSEIFESVQSAAQKMKISKSGIVACCKGYQKTAAGFHWGYVDVTSK